MAALPRLSLPGLTQFASLLERSQPAVLLGLLDRWPALRSWQRANAYGSLRTLGEGRLVDVEWGRRGRGFLDPGERGKSRMPLDLYLDAFLLDKVPSTSGAMADDTVFYVAQQDLLSDVSRSNLDCKRGPSADASSLHPPRSLACARNRSRPDRSSRTT